MSIKENFKETIKIIPESIRDVIKFCLSPGIDSRKADYKVFRNFLEVALITGAFITLLKSALPGTFKFDLPAAINPFILIVILIISGITFSLIFYVIVRGILALKNRSGYRPAILYQALKFFTIIHLLAPVLMMVVANQLMMKLSADQATNVIGKCIGAIVSFLFVWLLIRTLIKPTAKYLESEYKKSTALAFSILSCFLAFVLNPALKLEYYDALLDKKKICEFWVDEKFESEIINGTIDFHQKLSECSQNFGSIKFGVNPPKDN